MAVMSSGLATAPALDVWALEEDEAVGGLLDLYDAIDISLEESGARASRKSSGRKLRVMGGIGDDDPAAAEFDLLAEELEYAGAGVSSTRRLMAHRAYTEILALGKDAIPLLLERLR